MKEQISKLKPNAYVLKAKKEIINSKRYVSLKQAIITTKSYQENSNSPFIIRRAKAFKTICESIEINIKDGELLVGNRTVKDRSGIVSMESGGSWILDELDTINNRAQDPFIFEEEDKEILKKELMPYWKDLTLEYQIKSKIGSLLEENDLLFSINQTDHSQGHICPDFKTWLESGPNGLLSKVKKLKNQANKKQEDFYQAAIITLEGSLAFIERYRKLAEQLSEGEDNYHLIANNLQAIIQGPVNSFAQALQSYWILEVLLFIESNATSISPGRMDQILYPYYLQDIQNNKINQQTALDLLENFFLKCNSLVYMRNKKSAKYFGGFPTGFNIAISGKDENDSDLTNELSWLFLKAQEDLALPQPNLSVRLHKNIDNDFLEYAAKVVGKGSGMPQFFNDENIIPALIKRGYSYEDALNYSLVGCVEITGSGNMLGWSDAAMFNLVKALELTVNHGICLLTGQKIGKNYGGLDTYQSYEELEEAFALQLSDSIKTMIQACEIVDRLHGEIIPNPLLSCVIQNCLKQGKDVSQGGAKYNFSGIQAIQVANLTNSLAVLKDIYKGNLNMTVQELYQQLKNNWPNYKLRNLVRNNVAKYGNDISEVDELAAKWITNFNLELRKYQNYRGGTYQLGLYTVSAHMPMGENVGAGIDGRLAKEPLADGGLSPANGSDINGPTAVLKSVSKTNSNLATNGSLLNMKFLPSLFQQSENFEKFVSLIRTLCYLDINHIQFNVVNREDLLAAQKDPDSYRSLVIRVAGYSAYFIDLDTDLQNEIINRTTFVSV